MNKRYLIIILSIAVILIFLYMFLNQDKENNQIANPASTNCIEKGGTLEKVEFKNGTDNICRFEDGSISWEWDFYRGDCNKGDLKVETILQGEGERAARGDSVKVHYTGKLESNGTVFDSSISRGEPFTFTLGQGGVILGWEFGVLGMRTGEKRILTISPNLGYGNIDYGPIPANSVLIFEVELIEII